VIPSVFTRKFFRITFPRTRGGDPKGYRDGKEEWDFSPHTRG